MRVAVKKMKAVRTTCTAAKETSSAEKKGRVLIQLKIGGAEDRARGERMSKICEEKRKKQILATFHESRTHKRKLSTYVGLISIAKITATTQLHLTYTYTHSNCTHENTLTPTEQMAEAARNSCAQ